MVGVRIFPYACFFFSKYKYVLPTQLKIIGEGHPQWSMLPMQGAWVQSLIRELRSHVMVWPNK